MSEYLQHGKFKYIDKVRTKTGKIRYIYNRSSLGSGLVGAINNISGTGQMASLSQYYPQVLPNSVHLHTNKMIERKRRNKHGRKRAYSKNAKTKNVNSIPRETANYGKSIVESILSSKFGVSFRPSNIPKPHKRVR